MLGKSGGETVLKPSNLELAPARSHSDQFNFKPIDPLSLPKKGQAYVVLFFYFVFLFCFSILFSIFRQMRWGKEGREGRGGNRRPDPQRVSPKKW